ncbi:MAG: carbohydrate ABC transporter permease [Gammaproteobacteria bacterium]
MSRVLARGGPYAVLTLFAIVIIAPFLWIGSMAFKKQIDILMMKIVATPTLFNFEKLFTSKEATFINDISNSAIVAVTSTFLVLVISSMAAFTLRRLDVPRWFGLVILVWVIVFHMLPPITFVGSWFVMANAVGLFNSRTALILAHTTMNIPLGIWLMSSFISEVPREIQEAAKVDGCSNGQTFRKIMLPLVAPGLFATCVIVFLFSWNDFIVAVNLTAKATQTLPVSIATFSQQYEVRYGEMAAGSLVSLIPALVLSFFAQKYIVRGLTAGAVR